ncbi:hypothetical protein GGD46_004669 [Rhizobium lusitanum]|uniref:Uncharacterized protein n=1 Tax=Rhizobium lusitanum TaxID=293958 RepID=A0A7X0IWT1_9HYPH|nr:hypothetical protein [Rhizobium lusitanum]
MSRLVSVARASAACISSWSELVRNASMPVCRLMWRIELTLYDQFTG